MTGKAVGGASGPAEAIKDVPESTLHGCHLGSCIEGRIMEKKMATTKMGLGFRASRILHFWGGHRISADLSFEDSPFRAIAWCDGGATEAATCRLLGS